MTKKPTSPAKPKEDPTPTQLYVPKSPPIIHNVSHSQGTPYTEDELRERGFYDLEKEKKGK